MDHKKLWGCNSAWNALTSSGEALRMLIMQQIL